MATRILSPTEKRELDIAFQRQQTGTASPTDIKNLDYARRTLGFTPTSTATQPSQLAPLPMQAGEREAMINRYLDTTGMSQEQATARVDELFAGRSPVPAGQVAPPSLTFTPTGTQVSTRGLDIAEMGGAPAPTPTPTPAVDIGSSYQKAMTDLLRQYQTRAGGTDEDLQKQRSALIQARFGAQTDLTPERLRVLSPEAQSALRGQDVRGIESQLGGVSAALKSRATERSELRSVMEQAQDRLAAIEKEERQTRQEREKEERGYAFEKEKLSRAETLEREKLAAKQKEAKRETQIITANGRSLLIDKNTGETIKDLGYGYKPTTPKKVVEWNDIDNSTGKTPEQAFIEMGISQEMINMAKSAGLQPKDLF